MLHKAIHINIKYIIHIKAYMKVIGLYVQVVKGICTRDI